jgi:lambda family phage portal protein
VSKAKTAELVDTSGRPLRASAGEAYAAAGLGRELASWRPPLASADTEILGERESIVARTRDLIRNHGIAHGAVQSHLDNVIGSGLRLVAKPDHRALGIDAEVAQEWARVTEAKFRAWAEDNVGFYSDAGRRLTLAKRLSQGYRSWLASGEIVAVGEWLTRPGARYRTAIQMIDPDRLSNPMGAQDTKRLRAGVELDDHHAAVAYHFRSSHPSEDGMSGAAMPLWKRVPRETAWGRQLVLHKFEQERSGQTRGNTGFVSVISKLKMLEKFEGVSLQAAILNAMYAAVIESSASPDSIGQAMGADESPLASYVDAKVDFHKNANIRFDGLKIPHLFPGEKITLLAPQHPSAAFEKFEEAVLRHIAAGFNLSYEQLSRDYSKSNYSSARAAMLESWRFFSGRRFDVSAEQASWEYQLWLEEAIDIGDVLLPAGAPTFDEAKAAWCRCRWIGPGRNHIDPLKEAKAAEVELANNFTTLEEQCAERGLDWEEVLEQRAAEQRRMRELELTPNEPKPADAAEVGLMES